MECSFEIEVRIPSDQTLSFRPYVTFRTHQLNMTPHRMTETEIDYQIDLLMENVDKLRKQAKKKLKESITRHDQQFALKPHSLINKCLRLCKFTRTNQ